MSKNRQTSEDENRFTGFPPDSFAFFRELARNNNKPWFDENRARYEQNVVGVFRSLLFTLEPSLLGLNPRFETNGKTNYNFSRINRDIRFAKDKSPYKSNYYLYVFDRGRERQADGRLYVGLSAEAITVGFATYGSWKGGVKSTLETVFRKRFETHRPVFEKLLANVVRKGRYETYWHRMEKGNWAQHPGLPRRDDDWLSLHAWVVRKVFPAGSRAPTAPAFAARVEGIFRDLYPLYAFTSDSGRNWLAAAKAKPAR